MPNNPGNSSNPNDPKKKPINPAALGNPQIKSAGEEAPNGANERRVPKKGDRVRVVRTNDSQLEPYEAEVTHSPPGMSRVRSLDGKMEGLYRHDQLEHMGDIPNKSIKSVDVIEEVEPMDDLQDETLPDENPDSTTQAPHDPSSEPYGAQILRRIHDDHSRLLADYDSLLGPLEHPKVRKLMERKLQNIEKELCDFEALWGSDDIYKGLPPLEDAMDGDPDAMDGEPTEAIQEEDLDAVADEGYEDAPMEEGYPEEEFVEGDPYGGDDMDTMDDVAVPADSGAELEETPPEEAWEASQADDPLDKAIKSWEQASSQLKKKLVQTKANESSADQEGYEVVNRSPLAQNTEGAPHGVRHADKVDRELYAAAQQQTLHDLENGQDKIEMRKPGGDSPVVVNYRRDGRTVSSRGYQNTEQAKKQANKDTASRRRSGAEVSDVSERTQEKQMGKKASCLTCGKAKCICKSMGQVHTKANEDDVIYEAVDKRDLKGRDEGRPNSRFDKLQQSQRNSGTMPGSPIAEGRVNKVRNGQVTGGYDTPTYEEAQQRAESSAATPRRGDQGNVTSETRVQKKDLKDDLGAWDVNELHKVGEIQSFLDELASAGSSFDDEARMKSYHFHKIMDEMGSKDLDSSAGTDRLPPPKRPAMKPNKSRHRASGSGVGNTRATTSHDRHEFAREHDDGSDSLLDKKKKSTESPEEKAVRLHHRHTANRSVNLPGHDEHGASSDPNTSVNLAGDADYGGPVRRSRQPQPTLEAVRLARGKKPIRSKSGDTPGPGGEGTTKEERAPQAAPSLHTGGHSGVYEEGNRYDDVYEDDKSIHPHRKMCKDASGFFKKLSQERAFGDPHRQEAQGFYTKLSELLGGETKANYAETVYGQKEPQYESMYTHEDIYGGNDFVPEQLSDVGVRSSVDPEDTLAHSVELRHETEQWDSDFGKKPSKKSFNVTLDNQEVQLSKLQKTLESLSSVLGKY